MQCRIGCGACCIAPSISSPIPSMPQGKPANTRCVQLSDDKRCLIFDSPLRPEVCRRLQASSEMCGQEPLQAIRYLLTLEHLTAP